MWESEEEFETEMFETGCFDYGGVDENGEPTYQVNFERLEKMYPEVYDILWEEHCEKIDQTLSKMVDDGLLEMAFDGKEAVYSLTEYGQEVANQRDLTL